MRKGMNHHRRYRRDEEHSEAAADQALREVEDTETHGVDRGEWRDKDGEAHRVRKALFMPLLKYRSTLASFPATSGRSGTSPVSAGPAATRWCSSTSRVRCSRGRSARGPKSLLRTVRSGRQPAIRWPWSTVSRR